MNVARGSAIDEEALSAARTGTAEAQLRGTGLRALLESSAGTPEEELSLILAEAEQVGVSAERCTLPAGTTYLDADPC